MGKVITKLLDNLIIFRPYELEENMNNPANDYLFYIYDEYINEIREYMSEEYLVDKGRGLITIKELYINNVRKVSSIITPVVKIPQQKVHSISYNTFGFFLLIKFSIDTIISYAYTKGLIKLAKNIVNDINEYNGNFRVAYNLAQYFLENFNYEKGLDSSIINDLQNYETFTDYYKKFYSKVISIAKDNLTTTNIKDVFREFNKEFKPGEDL